MKNHEYIKLANDFIMNEGQGPAVGSYIQALEEALNSIRPTTIADMRRVEVAKENLRSVRRQVRRLEEKIGFLEEEMRTLQEKKTEEE